MQIHLTFNGLCFNLHLKLMTISFMSKLIGFCTNLKIKWPLFINIVKNNFINKDQCKTITNKTSLPKNSMIIRNQKDSILSKTNDQQAKAVRNWLHKFKNSVVRKIGRECGNMIGLYQFHRHINKVVACFDISSVYLLCSFQVIYKIQIIFSKIQFVKVKNKMQGGSITQKKNTFKLNYQNTQLTISGDFDSGNLNWAGVDEQKNEILLQFGKDKQIKPSSKCWFYFSISGNYNYLPVKLNLLKTNALTVVAKIYDLYRPVVKVGDGDWDRHPSPIQFEITPQNDINFKMSIQLYGSKTFYIAQCYPWSVTDNNKYLSQLQSRISKRKDLYYNRQTLIYSPQKLPVHLIALSSAQVNQQQSQDYIEHLFPNKQTQQHFKMIKKPLIMITSRVHPGQIGSSYALNGMIDYLTSGCSQAKKILNQFYFLIIPMLNPDGVANGNNRMDSLGQNLNRFYLLPQLEKQPSCYTVKSLLEHTRMQLYAFFDLHGHANKKSCFLFGNSINNQRLQIESILFAKYLSTICDYIEFKSCNFSKKQMSSKDKNQDLSKQGCARVVVHKWTNSPYCYTLQTGLFKNVKVDDKGIQRYGEQFYNPRIYAQVGAKMIISLYAILKKDKQIQEMRKQVALYVTKLEKLNAKRQLKTADKNSKKQAGTQKQLKEKKEQSTKQINSTGDLIKVSVSEKQNEKFDKFDEKTRDIQQILNKNKNYLLSLDNDDDDQY